MVDPININLYNNLQQTLTGNEANVQDALSCKGIYDALGTNVSTVEDIAGLQAYSGNSETILVKDSVRGGVFVYSATGTADNGVVFSATGIGTGFWVRQYTQSEGVNVAWFGVDLTGATDNTVLIASIIDSYDTIKFPAGLIQASINNTNSNRTFIFDANCIVDGGVVHLAIGSGPSSGGSSPATFVENIRVKGKLRTTSRVGTYYCRDLTIDDIEIVTGAYLNAARGVHFHYGSKNITVNNIVGVAESGGDYGVGINGGSGVTAFDPDETTENISIQNITIESVETGLLLDKVKNVSIGRVNVLSWGDNTNTWIGAALNGVIDSNISALYVNGSQATGTLAIQIRQTNCKNLNITEVSSYNAPFEGFTQVSPFSDNFFTNGVNENCTIGLLHVENSKKTGAKLQGAVYINNLFAKNNNITSDANASNVRMQNAGEVYIGNAVLNDSSNYGDGLVIITSSKIDIENITVNDANTFCIHVQSGSDIRFGDMYIANGAQNLRYEAAVSNLRISNLVSTGASTRDVTNNGATNVKIGFKGGLTFLNSPYDDTGFVKLGMDYALTAPVTGQHYRGHIYYQGQPAASGKIGFVCTADGNPGTWKTWGAIDA